MTNKIAFTTCGVWSKNYGDAYLEQQDRLVESIRKIYTPEEAHILAWRDTYPKNAHDWLESSYGFKVWAIQHALNQGYKRVVYMDTAMILLDKLELDHLVPEYGFIAVKDDSNLANVTWDRACEYFGVPRQWLEGKNLVGGSFYYLNAEDERAMKIFREWKLAEQNGIFGSQEGESAGIQNGHRCDETCMAICLYLNGSGPVSYESVGYQGKTMIKKHFR